MQKYELSASVATTTAANTLTMLLASGTARPDIREISAFVSVAGTGLCEIGIGRAPTTGTTPTANLGQPLNAADPAATCSWVTTWATKPVTPTTFFKRFTLPAVIGAGVVWSWEANEFDVPQSGGVSLFMISAPTGAYTLDLNAKWEE
jgi:hypothetical protein